MMADAGYRGGGGDESRVVEKLSRHFVARWKARVGQVPTVDGVNRILSEATKIRKQETVYKPSFDGGLEPYRILAEYCNWKAGFIIRVDEKYRVAVTVLTAHSSGNRFSAR
jgi:hypothetical protein